MNLWVDSLSWGFFFFFLWNRVQFSDVKIINVFSVSTNAEKLLCYIFQGLKIKRIEGQDQNGDYRFLKIRDESGRYLYAKIEEEADRVTSELIVKKLSNTQFLKAFFKTTLPVSWIERFFWFEIYSSMYRQSFILAIFKHTASEADKLYLATNSLTNEYIKNHAYFNKDRMGFYDSFVGSFHKWFKALIKLYKYLALIILNFTPGSKGIRNKRKIGVQYCWGHDLDRRSDLYWLKDSSIPHKEIIFYFNRSDIVLSDDLKSKLAQQGYSYVIPRRNFLIHAYKQNPDYWYPDYSYSFDLMKSLIIAIKQTIRAKSLFVFSSSLSLYENTHYWKHFYSDHGIRLNLCHSGDRGVSHVINSLACELAQGVNVRSTYSYRSYDFESFSREFHLFLLWGKQPGATELSARTWSTYQAIVGYIFDHLLEPQATSLNDFFKISLFDTTSNIEELFSFYSKFINLLERFPQIQLFIKPKKLLEHEFFNIFPMANKLVNEGRIILLNRKDDPQASSKDANLVVCLTVNSAGIEAALRGKKVVYWIPDCMENEQMKNSKSKVLYYDLNELTEAVTALVFSKDKVNVGDHGDFIEQIDPFRDGKAYLRTGWIIETYLKNLNLGSTESLKKSLKEYGEKWKTEYVSSNDLNR